MWTGPGFTVCLQQALVVQKVDNAIHLLNNRGQVVQYQKHKFSFRVPIPFLKEKWGEVVKVLRDFI